MNGQSDAVISRREALKGGSAAAVAVGAGLLSNQLVRRAQAASSGDPRIVMGDAATSPDEAGEAVRNGADWEFYSGGAVRNLTTPSFQELEVTNETLVQVTLSADESLSSGTYSTLQFDSEGVDKRDEFDTVNHEFVPDKDGWYQFIAGVAFNIGAAGDEIQVNLKNKDGDGFMSTGYVQAADGDRETVFFGTMESLNAGDRYVLEVKNANSDDTVRSNENETYLTVRRVF